MSLCLQKSGFASPAVSSMLPSLKMMLLLESTSTTSYVHVKQTENDSCAEQIFLTLCAVSEHVVAVPEDF